MTRALDHRTHQPIGFGAALNRQLRLLWTTRRPLLLVVAAMGVLALIGPPFIQENQMGGVPVARLLPLWGVFVFLIGPIWAFAVFHNEGPDNRYYHWSHPVSRAGHTLARVAAGAIWLVAAYLVLVVAGFLFAVADGNAWQLTALPGSAWVNFFTGPLIGYLGVSAITVISDYPLRWFIGLVFLFPLVIGLTLGSMGMERVMELLAQPVVHERWGLGPTLGGAFALGAAEVLAEVTGSAPVRRGNPADWWLATAFWTVIVAGLTAVMSLRHPDRRPRLWPSR
jgi:hypothetical protein